MIYKFIFLDVQWLNFAKARRANMRVNMLYDMYTITYGIVFHVVWLYTGTSLQI